MLVSCDRGEALIAARGEREGRSESQKGVKRQNAPGEEKKHCPKGCTKMQNMFQTTGIFSKVESLRFSTS